jgi:hypothetical protein
LTYVVGGYSKDGFAALSTAVDQVLAGQVARSKLRRPPTASASLAMPCNGREHRHGGRSGYNAPSSGGDNRIVLRFLCSAIVSEFVVSTISGAA